MILERSTELRRELTRLRTLKNTKKAASVYGMREGQLRPLSDLLTQLVATLKLFQGRGIVVAQLPSERARLLHQKLSGVYSKYSESPDVVADEALLRDVVRDDLPDLARRLDETLRAAWSGYTNNNMRQSANDILQVLERFPVFKATVSSIRQLEAQLKTCIDTLPQTESDIQTYHDILSKLSRMWQDLNPDDPTAGFPSDVVDFLRAVGAGGAHPDLLTDQVRDWLTDQGIKDYFNVVIKKTY